MQTTPCHGNRRWAKQPDDERQGKGRGKLTSCSESEARYCGPVWGAEDGKLGCHFHCKWWYCECSEEDVVLSIELLTHSGFLWGHCLWKIASLSSPALSRKHSLTAKSEAMKMCRYTAFIQLTMHTDWHAVNTYMQRIEICSLMYFDRMNEF